MPKTFVKGLLGFLKDLVIIVAAALLISFLVKTFLFRSFFIPSASMENTLMVDDRIIVNELVPDVFPLQHGDVVVFSDPGGWLPNYNSQDPDLITAALDLIATVVGFGGSDSEDHLVKRLIGLPGDRVVCCDPKGLLQVNGESVKEPYIVTGTDDDRAASGMKFDIIVPDDSLWVMGDNRYDSADSRYNQDKPGNGFVPIDKVVGRAVVVSWPISHWTWLDNYAGNFANAE
jgi:signal peptidase I